MIHVERTLRALDVDWRRHGPELWAACPHPDHDERRPSWSIRDEPGDPRHGRHYCFGCGWGGGPIELVSTVLGRDRGEARAWLVTRGLLLERAPMVLRSVLRLVPALRDGPGVRAPAAETGPLEGWPTPARRYLERRGVPAWQVDRWRLCYAVDGVLAGRVVFPVEDELGHLLSYHARSYAGHEQRYRNASEADGQDPGGLFGQRYWPAPAARGREALVLTEGALDALACERVGARFVAAIGGSRLHPRQLLRLCAWGTIVVATDGDDAGDRVFDVVKLGLGRTRLVLRARPPAGLDAAAMPEPSLKGLLWHCLGTR